MAETFRNVVYSTFNYEDTLYTPDPGVTAIVIGCQAANKSNAGPVELTMDVKDGNGNTEFLVNEVFIPQNASIAPIAGKLVLATGDQLRAKTGANGDASIIVSILEIS